MIMARADVTTPTPGDLGAQDSLRRSAGFFLGRGLPASLFALRAMYFWIDFQKTGKWTSLMWIISEGLVVVLFVVRRDAHSVSRRPSDWGIALAASITVLLVRPAEPNLAPLAAALLLQILGVSFEVVAKASLGRSFGIVPANRGIVTKGAYRLVRHPIYLGYLVTHIGFVLANASAWNVAVLIVAWSLQVLRIFAEERFLRDDRMYASYCRKVRYRLIPGVL